MLRPESNNVTLVIACPVTGAGSVSKAGLGLLVLSGANSYTGLTSVLSGALRPDSTNALGVSPLLVRSGASLVRRYPDAGLTNGVMLGAGVTFESGSHLDLVWNSGFTVGGNFTVPLFSVPAGVTVDPANVPVRYSLNNYRATVVTSALGGRTLVSVQLRFCGTVLLVQ